MRRVRADKKGPATQSEGEFQDRLRVVRLLVDELYDDLEAKMDRSEIRKRLRCVRNAICGAYTAKTRAAITRARKKIEGSQGWMPFT